jgi:hypothetical protein
MKAWTMLDGGSQLYTLIHEERIRRELILRSIEDEVYIHGRSHEKKYVLSLTLEEFLFEEKP